MFLTTVSQGSLLKSNQQPKAPVLDIQRAITNGPVKPFADLLPMEYLARVKRCLQIEIRRVDSVHRWIEQLLAQWLFNIARQSARSTLRLSEILSPKNAWTLGSSSIASFSSSIFLSSSPSACAWAGKKRACTISPLAAGASRGGQSSPPSSRPKQAPRLFSACPAKDSPCVSTPTFSSPLGLSSPAFSLVIFLSNRITTTRYTPFTNI